jgi:hypothetical protein
MKGHPSSNDLIILADKNTCSALEGILSRPEALGIRPIQVEFVRYSLGDPGILRNAVELLRPYLHSCQYALVILDWEGSGREKQSPAEVEKELQEELERNGWEDRCCVIVIDPELEVWVWTDSPHVPEVLRWRSNQESKSDLQSLKEWLARHRFLQPGQAKPSRPKEAMEEVLRQTRIPRSSALYKELANKVSLRHCTDRAFCKLTETLRKWFPAPENETGQACGNR